MLSLKEIKVTVAVGFSRPGFLHETLVGSSRQRWANRIPTPNRDAESPPETFINEGFFLSTTRSHRKRDISHRNTLCRFFCWNGCTIFLNQPTNLKTEHESWPESQVNLSTHLPFMDPKIYRSRPIEPPSILSNFSSWWLNQPIWKIWSSNWIISPNKGEHQKKAWNNHLVFLGLSTFWTVGFLLHPTLDLQLEKMRIQKIFSQMVVKKHDDESHGAT